MKEDFLHYVWQYKKFDFSNLKTCSGEKLTIINVGQYLKNSGPDFFNAQIVIGNQKWAGNVEIHVKSSDWYLHNHENDENYDNVILHVVWENDVPVFGKSNSEIPVLCLKDFVSKELLNNYHYLTTEKKWIFCENDLGTVDEFVFNNWLERVFFERLEKKSQLIENLLLQTNYDWEAVLFCMLAKNFGLNTNGEIFLKIAQSIPFSVIRKESFEIENLEALFFGYSGLLNSDLEHKYPQILLSRFNYLVQKHQLVVPIIPPLIFFKLRPENFPTIRIAQLAMLYNKQQNLFSKIMDCNSIDEIYKLLDADVSIYWQNHYHFEKANTTKKRKITKSFIDLIIINTIVPLQFSFAKYNGKDNDEIVLHLLRELKPEANNIIDKFQNIGIKSTDAFMTQSLIQLKTEYCNKHKCLSCSIGLELLKK
ncbi:DUF2851 family protein [Flavobacterium sp.]|uniref:DUF2851 family protein n=1 Tax=Flavobacterium sp. TaxID=239 RepID=UPI0035AE3EA7